jgi:hypothetical protein
MAFIRTIRQGDRLYRAVVKNTWDKTLKKPRQKVVKWLGRAGESVLAEDLPITMSCRSKEEKYLFSVLAKRRSLLVHGQWGVGKTFLAQRMYRILNDAGHPAHYFRWTSPIGEFIKQICEALTIATQHIDDEGKTKRKTQAELLEEIGGTLHDDPQILIIDKAQDIPKGLRNHIEVWLENGACILLMATLPKKAEMYLKVPRWELKPLDQTQSLKLVLASSRHYSVKLKPYQARELATKGNGNPQFLIRSIAEIDIQAESDPDQAEWIDGSPIVLSLLGGLMMLRYLALGLSDRNLMVMAGMGIGMAAIARVMISRASKKRTKIGGR